ncbi:hypothetical protein M2105_000386 [Paenibacillus sp. PastF-1]|nr:hypothetical protein [Paenibacillus sp. PastF-2]MDF9845971.1 hypothetical protein [Paenibacillus sp. PastM-2]MDF9852544.1 hypothetical protein [Paenibacillus sp. PastF-1]MDH6477726.1 hypothetical protein [Paenibacillus sp. PastH-2]MDH6505465.1 hypothetical protein [Paenibacillus sp. PastM-3]
MTAKLGYEKYRIALNRRGAVESLVLQEDPYLMNWS